MSGKPNAGQKEAYKYKYISFIHQNHTLHNKAKDTKTKHESYGQRLIKPNSRTETLNQDT